MARPVNKWTTSYQMAQCSNQRSRKAAAGLESGAEMEVTWAVLKATKMYNHHHELPYTAEQQLKGTAATVKTLD